jgi:acetyl esterase/lipase
MVMAYSFHAAIAFHGGGFTIGSRDMIPHAQIASLTEAGFVVVAPDYQLCPGISIYDGPLQDAKDIYTWCKTKLPEALASDTKIRVDPTRIVTVGYSAGALMALYLVSRLHRVMKQSVKNALVMIALHREEILTRLKRYLTSTERNI